MLRRDNIVDFRGDGAHDLVISGTPKQNHRGGTWHAFDPGTLPYCGEVNPMIGLPTLAYAALSKIVYHDEISEYGGFTRQALYSDKSGFHAALYRRSWSGRLEYILSYAGTEDATMDVNADLGFASMNLVLAWQVAYAHAFATKAQQSLKGHHLSLTGHSLGGGLAQIIAARTSLPAVTFSAPEVTSVRGVEADYIRNKPKIVNFAIFRDPINATLLIGRRIGKTYVLPSNRTGIAAHSIDKTVEELMPQGQFSPLGMVDPFAT